MHAVGTDAAKQNVVGADGKSTVAFRADGFTTVNVVDPDGIILFELGVDKIVETNIDFTVYLKPASLEAAQHCPDLPVPPSLKGIKVPQKLTETAKTPDKKRARPASAGTTPSATTDKRVKHEVHPGYDEKSFKLTKEGAQNIADYLTACAKCFKVHHDKDVFDPVTKKVVLLDKKANIHWPDMQRRAVAYLRAQARKHGTVEGASTYIHKEFSKVVPTPGGTEKKFLDFLTRIVANTKGSLPMPEDFS